MSKRNGFIIYFMVLFLGLSVVESCSLVDGIEYGEDCPDLQRIALISNEVCSIEEGSDKLDGECKAYALYFEKNKCPANLPKCHSQTCSNLSCFGGQIFCQDKCVDPQTDNKFCGASGSCVADNAGIACVSGQICVAGRCEVTCVAGQIVCDNACVDPEKNRAYCGASDDCMADNAGSKCASGQVCSEGACGVSCVVGQVICGSECVDPSSDRRYCGVDENCAAGKECVSGEVCSNGACAVSCVEGQIVCGNKCLDPNTTNAYCGASGDCLKANAGSECKSGQVCSRGKCEQGCAGDEVLCDGKCIIPSTNNLYCGASGDCQGIKAGKVCLTEQSCSAGSCVNCPTGQIYCANSCIDPLEAVHHCGASAPCSKNLGVNCDVDVLYANSVSCVGGACDYQSCKANYGDCDGQRANGCESPVNTSDHCGTCGNNCSALPHVSIGACQLGSCSIKRCETGYADCNGNAADGCEVDIQTSVSHCGGCSLDCLALEHVYTATCRFGECLIVCDGGFGNCNGSVDSGCETDTDYTDRHCGVCDHYCEGGTRCQAGECLR